MYCHEVDGLQLELLDRRNLNTTNCSRVLIHRQTQLSIIVNKQLVTFGSSGNFIQK